MRPSSRKTDGSHRGLRAHRGPPVGSARQPSTAHRLALHPPLRFGCDICAHSSAIPRTGTGRSNPKATSVRRADATGTTRSSSKPISRASRCRPAHRLHAAESDEAERRPHRRGHPWSRPDADGARDPPRLRPRSSRGFAISTAVLVGIAGPDAVSLRTPIELEGRDLRTYASFEVAEGERVPFVLTWFPSNESLPAGVRPRVGARGDGGVL